MLEIHPRDFAASFVTGISVHVRRNPPEALLAGGGFVVSWPEGALRLRMIGSRQQTTL